MSISKAISVKLIERAVVWGLLLRTVSLSVTTATGISGELSEPANLPKKDVVNRLSEVYRLILDAAVCFLLSEFSYVLSGPHIFYDIPLQVSLTPDQAGLILHLHSTQPVQIEHNC